MLCNYHDLNVGSRMYYTLSTKIAKGAGMKKGKRAKYCPKCKRVTDWILREISEDFEHLKCVKCGYTKTRKR